MPGVIGAMLEVGPAIVQFRPNRQSAGKMRVEACKTSNSTELISVALSGIDDTTVLFREQPVDVDDLWRRVVSVSVETPCESVVVVHPSWWAHRWVARVVAAATTVATDVRALSRAAMIAADDRATVVEIADEVVAISRPDDPPAVMARPTDPVDVAEALETDSGAGIFLDAPPGVAGAAEYAEAVRVALRRRGIDAQLAGIGAVAHPPAAVRPAPTVTPPPRWRGPALTAASVVLTLCAIGVAASRTRAPAPVVEAVNFVEGRITLQIPAQWEVTRITAGPGSRRVQASSPSEPTAALHVTQSYSPGETLDRTADVLQQALDEQPRGVFVDFNPTDRRGGRPAVTYREVRVGRDIRWTVVLDGATRISVGCQSAPGREEAIAGPCEKAIESAHESTGTNRGT